MFIRSREAQTKRNVQLQKKDQRCKLGKKVIEYIEELDEKGERPKNSIDEKLLNLLHDEVKANVVEDMRDKEGLI